MARTVKSETSAQEQVHVEAEVLPVEKPNFFQKHKVAIVAAIAFVGGAAVEAITAGFKQKRQLNLVESSDPLVEINEPAEEN